MSDIKFQCPKCLRPMAGPGELLSEIVTCPDCSEEFIPRRAPATPGNGGPPWTANAAAAARVERVGRFLCGSALVASLLAAASVMLAIFAYVSGMFAIGFYIALSGGGLLSLALPLYIAGTVGHIRALLMRR